jgi:pyruvate/2-oxoglutarate dehydrogenase complex dihydrolipoamide acyltransferase (E2) component
MAKKKDKSLKSLQKDVARLKKRNDKLAEAIEQTREDQAAAHKELRNLIEKRLPVQDTNSGEQEASSRDSGERPEVTEAAERRAGELGIDLSELKGTGSRGRILVTDVEAAADAK